MNNKKFLLPYGDLLREFLTQPNITKADIKGILRRRGVYFSTDEKTYTIPVLIKTGISPFELEELIDKIQTKEDSPKVHTQSISWSGGEITLLDVIPSDMNIQEVVDKPFLNYKVIGAPNFKAMDGNRNHIEMEFKIERYDLTKSFENNISQYSGKIILKKGIEDTDVNITIFHTSQETKFVADQVSRRLIKNMKEQRVVNKDANIRKIRFNDFTNEDRILFLQELTQTRLNSELYFRDTKDIGFCPDKKETLPDNISWMEDKINSLILKGKKLHTTFFVEDKNYHKYLEVYRIEAEYYFQNSQYVGDCRIEYEFSDFINREKNDAELTIKVTGLKFNNKKASISVRDVKEYLLFNLEESKLKLHDKYRQKSI